MAVLAALSIARSQAAISFVQSLGTQSVASAGTTTPVTVPAGGVAAGNSVVLTLAMGDASGAVTATDTAGNVYAVDADVTNALSVRTVVLPAHNVNALTAGNTITVTHPSTAARALSANGVLGCPSPPRSIFRPRPRSSTTPSSGRRGSRNLANECSSVRSASPDPRRMRSLPARAIPR